MHFAANEEVGLAVFRESNDALIVFDLERLTIVTANPACLRLARTELNRLEGRSVIDFIHSSSGELASQLAHSLNQTHFFHSREGYQWKTAGLPAVPLNITISRIHTKPQPFGLLVLRDVSEREQAIRELNREVAFRRAVVEHAADGICVFHRIVEPPFARFTVWNNRMAAITGLGLEDVNRGGGLNAVPYGEKVPHGEETWVQRMLDGCDRRGEEWCLALPDGRQRVMAVSTSTLIAEGSQARILAIVQDVTERKQAEEALRAGEERFRALVESVPDGIFVQTDGRFAFLNDNAIRLLGAVRPDQLLGTLVSERLHPDFRDRLQARLRGAPATFPAGPPDEARWLRLDGSPLEAEYSAVPFVSEGRPGNLVIFRDIAGRKRQEEWQLRSQKLESLGDLASGIAHDFNNILYAIHGYAEVARLDLPAVHPALASLDEIAKGCIRAADLVRRILAFSRPQQLQRKPTELQPLVEEVMRLLRPSLPATLELRSCFAPDVSAVLAEPGQLHQALLNLGANAAHAIGLEGGWIEFRLEAVEIQDDQPPVAPGLQPGRYACLSVADNGCGMDEATQARIFNPYFTTKPLERGTGLGLAVVLGIVKRHEGTIVVESQPGVGSTFRLYFPATNLVPETPAREPCPPAMQPGTRVLYVDDEAPLVLLAKRMLQHLGYVVTGFTNPVQAAREFAKRPHDFDALVTDLAMPGMNGFELIKSIQGIRPDLPIVMTSGYVRDEDRDTAQRLGVRGLILKPDTVDELGLTLSRLL
jgi:PAS domain S-box-containing protein